MKKYKLITKYLRALAPASFLLFSFLVVSASNPAPVYADQASCELSGGNWISNGANAGPEAGAASCQCPGDLRPNLDGDCIGGQEFECELSGGNYVSNNANAGPEAGAAFCQCPGALIRGIDGLCDAPQPDPVVSQPTEGEQDLESVLGGEKDCSAAVLSSENCEIVGYLVLAINIMSAVAGMAIVFSIMFAGFQYMTAQDNPGQIQQARTRIIWAISALLLFLFSYAILNFLVPGGVL